MIELIALSIGLTILFLISCIFAGFLLVALIHLIVIVGTQTSGFIYILKIYSKLDQEDMNIINDIYKKHK